MKYNVFTTKAGFKPSQRRDEDGKWTDGPRITANQKINLAEDIFRHSEMTIRKFVSRARKIGMDIPRSEDLVGGGGVQLYISDSISNVAWDVDVDELIKWAEELGIDWQKVEDINNSYR